MVKTIKKAVSIIHKTPLKVFYLFTYALSIMPFRANNSIWYNMIDNTYVNKRKIFFKGFLIELRQFLKWYLPYKESVKLIQTFEFIV